MRRSQRDDETVTELAPLPGERYLTHGIERILSLDGFGAPSSFRLQRLVRDDVDLLHLHNIHGGTFNVLNVPLLPDDLPVVWTFHDMWPLTGNCVHSHGCERFTTTCGRCPELGHYPSLAFDTTRLLLAVKRRLLDRDGLSIVLPSRWMAEVTARSHLGHRDRSVIPNGIDVDRFEPQDGVRARDRFGIAPDDTVLLFSAPTVSNPKKGIDDLLEALGRIAVSDLTLLAVGRGGIERGTVPSGIDVVTPGYLTQERMIDAYNAADVTAIVSKGESFCLTATESMACETPVVGYRVGGVDDQLTDEVGWPVEPDDVDGLAAALDDALTATDARERRGARSRRRVEERFEIGKTVDRYHELYRSILTG